MGCLVMGSYNTDIKLKITTNQIEVAVHISKYLIKVLVSLKHIILILTVFIQFSLANVQFSPF